MTELVETYLLEKTGVDIKISIDYGDSDDEGEYFFYTFVDDLSEEELEHVNKMGFYLQSIGEFSSKIFNDVFSAYGSQKISNYDSSYYNLVDFPITYDPKDFLNFERKIQELK